MFNKFIFLALTLMLLNRANANSILFKQKFNPNEHDYRGNYIKSLMEKYHDENELEEDDDREEEEHDNGESREYDDDDSASEEENQDENEDEYDDGDDDDFYLKEKPYKPSHRAQYQKRSIVHFPIRRLPSTRKNKKN